MKAVKDVPARPSSRKLHRALLFLALGAATLAVFWPVLHADFLNYDDPDYITENPFVLRGIILEDIAWAFSTFHAGNWHPLTWLSHMVDCQVFGLHPAGHHAINLLFHLVNTLLLFWIFARMTGALWRSAFVAAAFALHPLHVESVAWISERKDVLSTCFGLLSLLAYVKYVEHSTAQGPEWDVRGSKSKVQDSRFKVRGSRWALPTSPFYFLSLFLFALSLMSKSMLVTLPWLLLLLDYWPLRRLLPQTKDPGAKTLLPLLREKIPFVALSLAACAITLVAQQRAGAVAGVTSLSLATRIESAAMSYLRYAKKMFWPSDLAAFYPYVHWPAWEAGCAVLALLLTTVFAVKSAARRPWLVVGWFWFLGALVPVIGLVQVGTQSMADRYSYLPLVGLFLIVAWEADALLGQCRWRALATSSAALCVLGGLAAATSHQVRFWENSAALFRHALAVTSENAFAHNNLGDAISHESPREAGMHFQAALGIGFRRELTLMNLGRLLQDTGRIEQAKQMYLTAVRLEPGFAPAHCKLSLMAMAEQNYAEAITHWRCALQSEPEWPEISNNLAWMLATCSNPAFRNGSEAVRLAERACALKGPDASFLDTLAAAYAESGRYPEATNTIQKAIALAEAAGQTNSPAKLRSRFELYRQQRPYHEL